MASGEAVMCACFPGRVDPGVCADGHSKATGGGALGGKRVLLWTCIDEQTVEGMDESKQWNLDYAVECATYCKHGALPDDGFAPRAVLLGESGPNTTPVQFCS